MSLRAIKSVSESQPAVEGAGVHLRRAFGFGETSAFDPFLLFDDFRNERPEDYRAGFPWHPHRGIETITYVLAGSVEHGDSLGNQGSLGAGDVQWMTAGRGILHQEMPQGDPQAGQQFANSKGLGEIVIGTGVECRNLVGLLPPRRENNDRHPRPAAEFGDYFEPADIGKSQVKQHNIGRLAGGGEKSRTARFRFRNVELVGPERGSQESANLLLVFDH